MNKLNIVLVGVGKFGMNHLRVLKELEINGFCNLSGVIDVDLNILDRIEKKYGIKTSTKTDDFITNNIDAFDIVTPTHTHFVLCKKLLESKKHVFVEKPLTIKYSEAKILADCSHKINRILMVGHIFRYNEAVNKIKDILLNGELGKIHYLSGHFMGISNPRNDTGVIYNLMIHHIDLYNYLLGTLPHTVQANTAHFLGRPEYEDHAILTMKYPDNVIGIIEGSWMPPEKQRDLTIVGSKKSLTCDLLNQTINIYDVSMKKIDREYYIAQDKGSSTMKISFVEPLKLELLDFIESIVQSRAPLADAKSAQDAVLISEIALASSKKKMELRVNDWL